MKLLPIGVDDFKKLTNGNYEFVDKSLFIKDILADGSEVILITRPRRFGKTINMSMLYYYFTNNVSEQNSNIFANLLINQYENIAAEHYQQYPTIFITFKEAKFADFESTYAMIADIMGETYGAHKSETIFAMLSISEQNYFDRIINKQATFIDLTTSLTKLIKFLQRNYNKNVMVIIDEYDTPIYAAYNKNYYEPFIDFFRAFLGSALKGNTKLHKAIITGITKVGQASIFSDLNNFKSYSVLSKRYGEYFGFSEQEVGTLLAKASITPEQTKEIKAWYNGYNIGDNTIYNPWSILNCLSEDLALKPYWVNTSSNDLIKSQISNSPIEAKELFEQLLQGNAVSRIIDENMVFSNLKTNTNALWSLLLFSGYLTIGETTIGRNGLPYGLVSIPNKEVASLYIKIIEEWFAEGIGDTVYVEFIAAFVNYDVLNIELYLQRYINRSGSYFDFTKKKEPEQIYHVFVLGLVAGLGDRFRITSNQEAGDGRYDVALIPFDKTKPGIIIEFKTAATEAQLENTSQAAIKQIEDKKYTAIIFEQNINKVLLIGLAFCGKNLKLAYKKLELL